MTTAVPVTSDWLVLLEALAEGGSVIDRATLGRLVGGWATPTPTAFYSPDRYAVHVAVRATDPLAALSAVIRLWKDAVCRTGLPAGQLVRVEIVTRAQLEEELRAAERAGHDLDAPPPNRPTEDPVADDLLRRALHDPVTGLARREIFLDDVRRALRTPARPPVTHAVMVLSLDARGASGPSGESPVADDVLIEAARRLTGVVRCTDAVARVGPARFAVLVDLPSGADSDRLAQRIVGDVRWPVMRRDDGVELMASVGVASMCGLGDGDALMSMAEAAMRSARDAGGDCHRQFAASAGGFH